METAYRGNELQYKRSASGVPVSVSFGKTGQDDRQMNQGLIYGSEEKGRVNLQGGRRLEL